MARAPGVSATRSSPADRDCGCSIVLQHQHGLEQRLAAERARRIEEFDQSLERQFLVGIGLQAGGASALEQFGKRGIAAGVGAQHQRIDEEADQLIEGGFGPSSDGGANRDVGAPAELGQQGGQGGLQEHEQRGALLARQVPELGVQLRGDGNVYYPSLVARAKGPWPVSGQRQLSGKGGQLLGPVGDLAGQRARGVVLAAKQGPLPESVISVLDGQGRKGGRLALEPRAISLGQVFKERSGRPPVGSAVVKEQQKRVIVGTEPEQRRSERDLICQVEAVRRGCSQLVLESLPGSWREYEAVKAPFAPAECAAEAGRPAQRAGCAGSRGGSGGPPAPVRSAVALSGPLSLTPIGML